MMEDFQCQSTLIGFLEDKFSPLLSAQRVFLPLNLHTENFFEV